MIHSIKRLVAAALLSAAAVIPFATHADAQQKGVTAGFLRCDVAGSVSFIFGSTRDLTCTYEASGTHRVDNYTGEIKQYGIDIGYQKKGVIVWSVVAPTNDVGSGALAGDYGGVNATVAAGLGVGANALFGGYKDSIALQPLSVEGIQGINIAAAIASVSLKTAP
jgi:Protein of unknown function (DUF992)